MAGEYQPDDQLPTVRELMTTYGIRSVSAIDGALTDLAAEGLIVRKHGGAILVRRRHLVRRDLIAGLYLEYRRAATGGGSDGFFETLTGEREVDIRTTYDRIAAPPRVAESLHLNPGALVLERTFRNVLDGAPHLTARSYMPVATADAAGLTSPEVERPGMETMAWLRAAGIVVNQVQGTLGSRPPSAEEAHALSLPPGTSVFEHWRVMCAGGRAVEVSTAIVRGDEVEYGYDIDLTGSR